MRLSWLLGLKRLGYKVVFVEEFNADVCGEEREAEGGHRRSEIVKYFQETLHQFRLHRSAALIDRNGDSLWGISKSELQTIGKTASLLINISGHLTCELLKNAIPIRVYVDLDPGFTQFWHDQGTLGTQLEGHTHYYTVGENIGTPDCRIPTGGIDWRPVRQPVVLEDWPVAKTVQPWRFTTIAELARNLWSSASWRQNLRAQGARIPQIHRAAAPHRPRVRDCSGYSSGRGKGSYVALRKQVAPCGPESCGWRSRSISRLRAKFRRRVFRRTRDLR